MPRISFADDTSSMLGVFWLNFDNPTAVSAEVARCGDLGARDLRNDFGILPLDSQVALVEAATVGRITLIGLFAHLATLIALALAPNLWDGIILIGIWDLWNTLIVINGIALRQQVTPDHLQERVNTTAHYRLGWSAVWRGDRRRAD